MRPACLPDRRICGALVVGAALAVSGAVRAQSSDEPLPKLAVTRSADAGDCPDAPALADSVGKLTGRLPQFDTTDEGAQGAAGFDVDIKKAKEGFIAVVSTRAQVGAERKISDPGATCGGLAQALALTLAMLLDKDQPPPEPGARTAEGPGPGPPSARRVEQPAPPPPELPPGPRRSRGLALDGGVAATLAVLDGPWLAQFAEVEFRITPRWSIGAGIVWTPTQATSVRAELEKRVSLHDQRDRLLSLSIFAASLRGCGFVLASTATFATWPPRVGGCVLGTLGQVHGTGSGFTEVNSTSTLLWATAGAALIAEEPLADLPILGPIALTGRLGFVVPLVHGTFAEGLEDQTKVELFSIPPIGAFFGLGIRLSIL